MKVLFIGATGLMGSHTIPFLMNKVELTLAANTGVEVAGLPVTKIDITDWEETESVVAAGDANGNKFDAIVYCATANIRENDHHTDEGKRLYYENCIEVNVRGAYHVFEAARRAGIDRAVHIGSNASMMGTPRIPQIGKEVLNQARDLYAATKIFGEQVGRSYAYRQYDWLPDTNRVYESMQVICLRLGQPFFSEEQWLGSRHWRTSQPMYVGDTARAIECALQAPVRFGIYPIISAVDNGWILPEATEELGYTPGWKFTAENTLIKIADDLPPVKEPDEDKKIKVLLTQK
ncbi:MAG: SDR family NAD(P)-dependent oxidoreductase [Abditibacteriaceae bacterium]